VHGDVGRCHGPAQSGISRSGLGAAGQHEPPAGRQALHCLVVVGTPQPPRLSVLADDAAGLPDAKIFTIFEGTSEIQRMLIGRAVTGLDVR
jgi:alkylation response protein AidB-like acyl-CoA dehydrogenase